LHDGIGELYEVKASHVAEDASRLKRRDRIEMRLKRCYVQAIHKQLGVAASRSGAGSVVGRGPAPHPQILAAKNSPAAHSASHACATTSIGSQGHLVVHEIPVFLAAAAMTSAG
jgi:hypothetical protein